jgi:AraC-like DNA-binding protein
MPDPSQPPAAFGALVGGLHSSPVTIRHDGVQHGVQLGIKPLGARALLAMPAAGLASAVVSLDDVIGRLAHELRDRLLSVGGWGPRFAVIDDVLTRALTEPRRSIRPEVAESWQALQQSSGAVDVGSLAKHVGWSRRHLSAQFRAEFGLTPKVAARVLRFERSRSILVQPNRPSFAEIAAACGYADQAHMAREWRDLAGASPSGWLAAEQFPFVQDAEAVDDAW